MERLERAVEGLAEAARGAPGGSPAGRPDTWRFELRERLLGVADALAEESAGADDGWLSARQDLLRRERRRLLSRLSLLAPAIADADDPAAVTADVARFVRELRHHLQRSHDLLFDGVAMEVGGSE